MIRPLQDAIVERIKLCFDGVAPVPPVVPEYLDDYESRILTAVNGTLGLAISVREPKVIPYGDNHNICWAQVWIEVAENYAKNMAPSGTQKAGSTVAWVAMMNLLWDDAKRIRQWDPGNGWNPLVSGGIEPVNVGNPLIYRLTVKSMARI